MNRRRFLSIQAIAASEWISLSAPTAIVLPLRSAAFLSGESLFTSRPAIGARESYRPAGQMIVNGSPLLNALISGGVLDLPN